MPRSRDALRATCPVSAETARSMACEARERLRKTLGVRRLVRGYQVHGTVVGRVLSDGAGAALDSGGRPGLENAFECEDSTNQPDIRGRRSCARGSGLAAMVLTADCIPVALGAQGAVAALHAGWRGLAAGVLEEGVRALREVGGRGDVVAVVGPCAGACCYEVGEEVHAAFAGAHRDGRLIDLRAIAHEKLLAGRRRTGARSRGLHDLRRALLLPPPRRDSGRSPGRARMDRPVSSRSLSQVSSRSSHQESPLTIGVSSMVQLIHGLRVERVRANLAAVREEIASGGHAPGATRARSRYLRPASTCRSRSCRCSPRRVSGWSARIAPRIYSRRSRPTATCSRGISSARCRANTCARSCRTYA